MLKYTDKETSIIAIYIKQNHKFDKRLMLEKAAFESLCADQFTLSSN